MKILLLVVVCFMLAGCGSENYQEVRDAKYKVTALTESVILPVSVINCGNTFIDAYINKPGAEGFVTIIFSGTYDQIYCAINDPKTGIYSYTIE